MPFVIVGAIVAIVELLLLLRTPFAGEVFLPLMSGGIAAVLLLACRNAARTLRGIRRKRAPGIDVLDLGTDRKDPQRGLEARSRDSVVSPQVAGSVLVACVCALILLVPHVLLVPPLARCAGPRPAGAIRLDFNQAINAPRHHDGGAPLLARAVDAGDTRSACVLLELGVTRDAITPVLALAARRDDVAMTRLLLAKGVPLDARDPQGHTALMTAAENGKVRAAGVLLAAGADTRVRSVAGETATDIALRSGATAVEQAIRAAEAKRQ